MVFQKKSGGVKGKPQTPSNPKKKSGQSADLADIDMDFDESDSDDSDSIEQQIEKKTPGKTPKGKPSDKRVSFQVPGKNTPSNKTPKSENSIGKKQLTPGKAATLKEFQGMLPSSTKKNGTKRPAADDDDDDDDDDDEEEDDDDDDDDDEDDDDEVGADLDMLLDGASDDDDDDDDDDDEEEDEDEKQQSQKSQNAKQQASLKSIMSKKEPSVGQKTPLKNAEKVPFKKEEPSKNLEKQSIKNKASEKQSQSPSKEKEKLTPGVKIPHDVADQQKREKNSRTLFVGNLPLDVTATELKALSSDIVNVSIPHPKWKKKNKFAFLEFADEAKAEENYKILQSKKLRGQLMRIDFTGEKSKHQPGNQNQTSNLKKLFIPSLPENTTINQVAVLFKKASTINLGRSASQRYASIIFENEKDAAAAVEACKSAKIGDMEITVSFSTGGDKNKKKRKKKQPKSRLPSSKKMKLDVKQESDDDDDDDDDSDEE